jgi:ATP-binding cassette subfamily B (MDR/TAP) protein 1
MELTENKDALIESEVKWSVVAMAIVAVICFFGMYGRKVGFNNIGARVTYKIRQIVYKSILKKHIGWFDLRENSAGVLSSTITEDTSLINGAGSESMAPTIEAMFAMLTGIGIGFVYSWKMSLTAILISPILMIGSLLDMQIQKDSDEQNSE